MATELNEAGFATLLLDLLTPSEERRDASTGAVRFDVQLLAGRLVAATDWLGTRMDTADLGLGCFGASTGAAAALIAAANRQDIVRAVVSRGGRPDLAGAETIRATPYPVTHCCRIADTPRCLEAPMPARELMTIQPVHVTPDDPLSLAAKLMLDFDIGMGPRRRQSRGAAAHGRDH